MAVASMHHSRQAVELSLPDLGLPAGTQHGDLWLTEKTLTNPHRYLTCVAAYRHSGLWPLLVPADDADLPAGQAHTAGFTDIKPGQVLARWWRASVEAGGRTEPFGWEFPGLVRRANRHADAQAEAGNTGSVLGARRRYRLGLVHTSRPANALAVSGRIGGVSSAAELAATAAVLRSWEERFGATLITLGPRLLELSVAAPPRTRERSVAVAAEHHAFRAGTAAVDPPGGLPEHAENLLGTRVWRFGWR